jgi:hypothetical protein
VFIALCDDGSLWLHHGSWSRIENILSDYLLVERFRRKERVELARHRLKLDPALFESETEMVEKRFRLNNVVFRRTKADACRPDGSPLFARRWVHTESFLMRPDEKTFYEKLTEYLAEGFALSPLFALVRIGRTAAKRESE